MYQPFSIFLILPHLPPISDFDLITNTNMICDAIVRSHLRLIYYGTSEHDSEVYHIIA